jgi:translation initiation factor IF-2
MSDENGNTIKEATPSMPVEIMGLNTVPVAGSVFYVAKNEKQANDFIDYHKEKQKVAHQKDNSLTRSR